MSKPCEIKWVDCPELNHSEEVEAVAFVRCVYTKLAKETTVEYSELLAICAAHLAYMNQHLLVQHVGKAGTLSSRWEQVQFRFDVQGAGAGDTTWTSNNMKYATPELAEQAALNLWDRWYGMKRWRVVPDFQPKNEIVEANPHTQYAHS